MGWFATADSCKGAKELVQLTKSLSSELLTANLAADFYLGEIVVPAAKLKDLNVILKILQRKTIIDVDDQSDGDEDEGASAASAASAICAVGPLRSSTTGLASHVRRQPLCQPNFGNRVHFRDFVGVL